MNIAVAGTGYVGMSIATLLAQHNHVTAVDVIPEKVEKINNKISPIQDDYIEKYLAEKELDLTATLDGASAYKDADYVVIAAPTNYDPQKNFFDTHHIEDVIDLVLSVNPDAVMVIKSTIPVGYCRSLYVKYAFYRNNQDVIDLAYSYLQQYENSPEKFPYQQNSDWSKCKQQLHSQLLRRERLRGKDSNIFKDSDRFISLNALLN